MKKSSGYRNPVSDLAGVQTFVSKRNQKGLPGSTSLPSGDPDSYPQQVLPKKPGGNEDDKVINMGPASYNTPDADSQISERPRTLPKPGEEYGVPVRETPSGAGIPPMRTMKAIVRQRPVSRQQRQKGRSKTLSRAYYRKNRNKFKQQAKRKYNRNKNKPNFKKQMAVRRKNPKRFKRRLAKEKDTSVVFMWPGYGEELCYLDSVLEPSERILFICPDGHESTSVDIFLRTAVFLSEEDIDRMFDILDRTLGADAYDSKAPEVKKTGGSAFNYEKVSPHNIPANWRGEQNTGAPDGRRQTLPENNKWIILSPADIDNESTNFGHNFESPGVGPNSASSAKVIPNNTDIITKKALNERLALDYKALMTLASQEIIKRSNKVSSKIRFFNPTKGLFSYKSGDYDVKIKRDFTKEGNIYISCSCPFWVYQGSEYWAKKKGYLQGKAQGVASEPSIRDPEGEHMLCKHAVASLKSFKTFENIIGKMLIKKS